MIRTAARAALTLALAALPARAAEAPAESRVRDEFRGICAALIAACA